MGPLYNDPEQNPQTVVVAPDRWSSYRGMYSTAGVSQATMVLKTGGLLRQFYLYTVVTYTLGPV